MVVAVVATILALATGPATSGWYLIAPPWRLERPGPPQPDPARPMHEWTIESEHDSIRDCHDTRRRQIIDALRSMRDVRASRDVAQLAYARLQVVAADRAACVSTDDPRLH